MSKLERVVEVLANDLTYLPNPEQRRVKAAFWVRFNENPICEPQNLTLMAVLQLVGDGRLERWWTQPGFKEWFRNQDEFRERAALLADEAIDTIRAIMHNELAPPAARLTAAKLAMEISNRIPKKDQESRFLDDAIGRMDRKQLESFLSRNTHLLPPVTPLTQSPAPVTINEIKDPEST